VNIDAVCVYPDNRREIAGVTCAEWFDPSTGVRSFSLARDQVFYLGRRNSREGIWQGDPLRGSNRQDAKRVMTFAADRSGDCDAKKLWNKKAQLLIFSDLVKEECPGGNCSIRDDLPLVYSLDELRSDPNIVIEVGVLDINGSQRNFIRKSDD
jgi:hypothetical protein